MSLTFQARNKARSSVLRNTNPRNRLPLLFQAALKVMKSGQLHRYNNVGDEVSEVSKLETEFAAYIGGNGHFLK